MPAKFASLILGIFVILAVGAYGIATTLSDTMAPRACPADAMICSDGSTVTRTGPQCSFARCPAASSTASSTATISATSVGEGAHCGGFLRDAPQCDPGLRCQLNKVPDTGGTCVAETGPSSSGIRGTVTLGPTCPVEHTPPQPGCEDKPYGTLVAVFRASDPVHAVAISRSDSQGIFSVPLPPGNYVIDAGESDLPRCPQTSVAVARGYATISIMCDTGIR